MIRFSLEVGLILSALLFYVDFDNSFDAVVSVGNGKALIEVDQYEPFITTGNGGMFGEAAEFIYEDKLESIWTKDVVRYPAKGNFPYNSGESWHHVVGTWKNLNSTGQKGVLHLYFDGILVGEIKGFDHMLDWYIDDWEIRIGLGFNGKIDDFFILNSHLSEEAIVEIYRSGLSLGELLDLSNE